MLENAAEFLEVPPESLHLVEISERLDEPHSSRLKVCHSNLSALAQSIHEVNQSNRSLLLHSIQLVRGSLSLLNNLTASGPVYRPTGEVTTALRSGKVLSGRV